MKAGKTENLEVMISGITSMKDCEQKCLNNNSCAAYTFQPNQSLCYLFVELSPLVVECQHCTTATITTIITGKFIL